MYLRKDHAEPDIPSLRRFIKENPLGILTTAISSPNYPLLQFSHIPWVLDVVDETDSQELPKLRGHMARQNPHSKTFIEQANTGDSSGNPYTLEQEAMVIFNGPVHHYVTPKFYTETKPTTGKVVPTWNYSTAAAYGKATVYVDSQSDSTAKFLSRQLVDLTNMGETSIMGYSSPWEVSDAPEKYVELLKKAIIGIEIEVTKLEGKFKMSQESSEGDRKGIIEGFEAMDTETSLSMARTVKERADIMQERKSSAQ